MNAESDRSRTSPATSIGVGSIPSAAALSSEVVFDVTGLTVHYGKAAAVKDVSLAIHEKAITALIGPSGCGKSTVLRCFNRMNDLVSSARVDGEVLYHGIDLYGAGIDPIEVRRRVGMVFQRPNPFPKSIYDNVAYGLRILGMKDNLDDRVEQALRRAALWDEVKSRLKRSALGLSGGQQQRLCIARAIAVQPDVILLDEPASALDPISTTAIEDLMHELKREYTLVIVTHNMQQAARVAEMTAFFSLEVEGGRQPPRHPRRVRRDREDLHPAVRRAHRGLRHGTVRVGMRISFGEELAQLEAALQEEGDLALRALRSALNALARGDEELADEVISFDDEVDRRYVAIEAGVQSLLARQTPVAADLRLVLAVLRINLHLERMADYCVTVAKLTKLMGDLDVTDDAIASSIEDMGQRAEQMIRVAMDAFATRDAEKAQTLVELDELIDRANRDAAENVLSLGLVARGARVRPADARRLAVRRADRRPRRRHRRAGRLPRHRRVPRVQRRVAPGVAPPSDRDEREPHGHQHEAGRQQPLDRQRGHMGREARAYLRAGGYPHPQRHRAPQAVAQGVRALDGVRRHTGPAHHGEHEVRGGRCDVRGKAETGDEDRHVEDTAADAEEAGGEADTEAVERAARDRHPVAPLGTRPIDEHAQTPRAANVAPPAVTRDPERDAAERGGHDPVEGTPRHRPDEDGAADRAGERRRPEHEPAPDVDPPLTRIGDGARGAVRPHRRETDRGQRPGAVVRVDEEQHRREQKASARAHERAERADTEPQQDEQRDRRRAHATTLSARRGRYAFFTRMLPTREAAVSQASTASSSAS